jgi:DNA polymerase III alpha subunit
MSSARPFVHLHCHTDYSLLDGACEIGQLMDLVVEQKMPSVAMTSRSDTDRYNRLVLLCENQDGYRNLLKLVSTAFLEGFYYKPRIDKDLLAQHSKGLIAMSACLRGDINERQDRNSGTAAALAGDPHSAGCHQRFALHAQGRRARALNLAVHPDRQDDERSQSHAVHAARVLSQDA